MKRVVCTGLAVILAAALITGCGKKDETDYYMKGYDAVKEGRYQEALEAFQTAAKDGDDQAQKAADIVSGYLNAQEAYLLEDVSGAKEFLQNIPADYKYYAIGEDIDALRRKVYGGEEPKETPMPSAEKTLDPSKEKVPEVTADPKQDPEAFARHEEIDLELQQIRELVKKGYLDQAEERLDGLSFDEMTDAQKDRAQQYRAETKKQRAQQKESGNIADEGFTWEKAVEYVRQKYDLQGDMGEGPSPRYDDSGKKYYEMVIQDGTGDSAEILTLHVFADGRVKVVGRR